MRVPRVQPEPLVAVLWPGQRFRWASLVARRASKGTATATHSRPVCLPESALIMKEGSRPDRIRSQTRPEW